MSEGNNTSNFPSNFFTATEESNMGETNTIRVDENEIQEFLNVLQAYTLTHNGDEETKSDEDFEVELYDNPNELMMEQLDRVIYDSNKEYNTQADDFVQSLQLQPINKSVEITDEINLEMVNFEDYVENVILNVNNSICESVDFYSGNVTPLPPASPKDGDEEIMSDALMNNSTPQDINTSIVEGLEMIIDKNYNYTSTSTQNECNNCLDHQLPLISPCNDDLSPEQFTELSPNLSDEDENIQQEIPFSSIDNVTDNAIADLSPPLQTISYTHDDILSTLFQNYSITSLSNLSVNNSITNLQTLYNNGVIDSLVSENKHLKRKYDSYNANYQTNHKKRKRTNDIHSKYPKGKKLVGNTKINDKDEMLYKEYKELKVVCFTCNNITREKKVLLIRNQVVCIECAIKYANEGVIELTDLNDYYEQDHIRFDESSLYKCNRLKHARPLYHFIKYQKTTKEYIIQTSCCYCRLFKKIEHVIKERDANVTV